MSRHEGGGSARPRGLWAGSKVGNGAESATGIKLPDPAPSAFSSGPDGGQQENRIVLQRTLLLPTPPQGVEERRVGLPAPNEEFK